jgi:cobalt-zinc-cadmium efflux system protein
MLLPVSHENGMSSDHGSDHGHDHAGDARRAGERHRGRLVAAFLLALGYFGVEVVGGFVTNSLALLSDAGHMLTDVIGVGMALAAIQLASRGARKSHHTFGLYRLEILAALANAVLLFGVSFWVLYEAWERLQEPAQVHDLPMLVIASLGLVVNGISFALLRQGAEESLNVRAAYFEVVADALGSVATIVAAITMQLTGWPWVDPIVGAGIGLFILPRTWRLAGQAVRILLQAAPAHIDVEALSADLAELPGVVDVHDLHVWTLTSEMEVASAHLMISKDADTHRVLDAARKMLRLRYKLEHATLQVEPEDHTGCAELTW